MIHVAGLGSADSDSGKGEVTRFDSGTLQQVGGTTPVDELLYLIADPSGRYLYGVSGVGSGLVHGWRIAAEPEGLVPLCAPVSTGGAEPCHLAFDSTGRYLLVANYGGAEGGSIAVLPIALDGSIGAASVLARRTDPGPDRERQGESHVHQVVLGPDNEVLVIDLGADEVLSYLLVGGALVDPVVSRAPSGAGPRHLVRLAGGTVAVPAELDSTLLRARHTARELVDWVACPSTGWQLGRDTRNYPSDLRADTDGEIVYLANRGADSIAALSLSTGEILAEGSCGAWPRQLTIDGDLLYVAGTNSDEVNILDRRTLQSARQPIAVARPMCVVITPDPVVDEEQEST